MSAVKLWWYCAFAGEGWMVQSDTEPDYAEIDKTKGPYVRLDELPVALELQRDNAYKPER